MSEKPRAAKGPFASWGHRSLAEVEPWNYRPPEPKASTVIRKSTRRPIAPDDPLLESLRKATGVPT